MPETTAFSNYCARWREFVTRTAVPETSGISQDDLFNELALSLFALQIEAVPVYRRFCEARGIRPSAITHWSQIPALPVTAFKEFEVTSLDASERQIVFHSSGTTGQAPSRHFHNNESVQVYEDSALSFFQPHLLADRGARADGEGRELPERIPFMALTPSPDQVPRSSLVHMFDVIRRRWGADDSVFLGRLETSGAWAVDLEATLQAIGEFADSRRPVVVLGTAFSFVHLLDHCAANNLRLQLASGSRVMETGGYKGRSRSMPKNELHQLIEDYLGVPRSHIICEYGMSELSSQAYDRAIPPSQPARDPVSTKNERIFHFPAWARVQIISPETGRVVEEGGTGLVRIVDLANVRSVLAIQTEDLGVRRGDGFELLGRAALAEPRGCSLMAM